MKEKSNLSKKECIPCKGGVPSLKGKKIEEFAAQLKEGWKVVNEHHLEKTTSFPDFKSALLFTNKVGELAEKEKHHPDILLAYGKVVITIWTHKIDGLTESDFIFAAKCDEL